MFRLQLDGDSYLRLLEERHATEAFALVDKERAFLRQWLPWVDATQTQDDTLSFIRSTLEQFASGKGFVAGIWHQDHFCGVVGTHKLDMLNRKGEIGYWLGQSFQGKGLMTAACRALITHLLGDMGLNRVLICCSAANQRSAAVAQRLGFVEEGLAREAQLLHGHFYDLRRFAMLKKDWKPEPGRL